MNGAAVSTSLLALTLGACASFHSPFRSAVPQSKVRVLNLGAVQLTEPPNTELHRVMEKKPWQWRGSRAIGSPMQSMVTPVFLGGDDVFVATLGGGVGVYDLRSGHPKWFKPLSIGAAAIPYISDSFVYVVGMDKTVRKLRMDNGTESWKAEMAAESTGGVSASLGFVYVTADDETLVALDEKTGKTQWSYKRPSPSGVAYWSLRGSAYPLLSTKGDKIFAGFADGTFVCLEASSGQTLWERNFERAGLFQDADQRAQISKDGQFVYVPLVDSDLVVLKATDGTTLYKIPAGGGASPYLDETEGFMYVTLNTGAMQKVDLKSSKVAWTRELAAGFVGSATGLGPEFVGVVSSSVGLKVIDRKTGDVVSEFRMGPGAIATPAFDGRRLLLLSPRNQLITLAIQSRGKVTEAKLEGDPLPKTDPKTQPKMDPKRDTKTEPTGKEQSKKTSAQTSDAHVALSD